MRGDNLTVRFEVTDGNHAIPVDLQGILPDLFREGQGVVTEGALDAGRHFKADSVLAKHDETYMPKEVADALKKQGHWKDDGGKRRAMRQRRSADSQATDDRRSSATTRWCWRWRSRSSRRSCRSSARARDDAALMGVAGPTALAQFAVRRASRSPR